MERGRRSDGVISGGGDVERRLWLMSLLVVVALVPGCSRTGGNTSTSPPTKSADQLVLESAKSSVESIKVKDYAASYRALSSVDKKQVTEAEWARRCQEVEAVAGDVRTYRVTGSRWLDANHTIWAVDVEIDFAKLGKPFLATLFYEMKDGVPVQTMLWDRQVELAGDAR